MRLPEKNAPCGIATEKRPAVVMIRKNEWMLDLKRRINKKNAVLTDFELLNVDIPNSREIFRKHFCVNIHVLRPRVFVSGSRLHQKTCEK